MALTGGGEHPGLERMILRLGLYVVMVVSVVAALGDKVSPTGTGSGTAWIIFAVCLAGLAASARDFGPEE